MTLGDAIHELQQIFSRLDGHTQRQFWAVISGLRGPDFADDPAVKEATTCVIRGRVLPGLAILPKSADTFASCKIRKELASTMISTHFLVHASAAFMALGLEWGEVNPPA